MDLPRITARRTEEELNRKFAASIDAIFAGLMHTLSKTLVELDNVTDAPDTRMADFAHFGMAVERALSWPAGSFKDAYASNQKEQMTNSLDPTIRPVLHRAQKIAYGHKDSTESTIDRAQLPYPSLTEQGITGKVVSKALFDELIKWRKSTCNGHPKRRRPVSLEARAVSSVR